ncbi:hypothetical protein IWW36_002100 [Coemansia brasiliensis]|uniref:Nucleoside diphosphate kinase n=1 Tax=Coemansia brasiliensis TaxID=2650707 RepID=A0A9W8I7Q5_9FUNG|nr:hypothetical protein IWW36_002100 [Coemansia brasiliensis]
MLPSLNIFLGRSQRSQVGVFSGKSAPHLGVSLLFEDIKSVPAHSSRAAVRAMDDSANRTFAIVKPDALTPFKFQQIDALIKLNEFEIVRQKLVWLSEDQAASLFPERISKDDAHDWLQYITSAPSLALELAKPDAPLFWQITMGADDPSTATRDADSIRGILATDRIRNAVDGSQEPEDAARQLELVFSDAVPALPYDNFLMQRADDANATLALIKPDISGNEDAVARIISRILARGYSIKDRVDIQLSRAQAAAFYAQLDGTPQFSELLDTITSGPVIALHLEGDDVIRGWRMMIGPDSVEAARQQVPLSLRALLGTGGLQNAVYGSETAEAAKRELDFFFSPRIQVEQDHASNSAANSDPSAATEATEAGANDDKKKKKKQKKRRNKRKHAVTVGGTTAAAINGANSEDSDEEAEPEPAIDSSVELAQPSDPAYERTFALIKPDAHPRFTKQVIRSILSKGLTVVAREEVQLPTNVAQDIYSDMASFPAFSRLVEFVTSAPVLVLVLEGVDAVLQWRELVGPTNPRTAKFEARDSLRAKYGSSAQMNAVHASKDSAEAQRSIKSVFYGLLNGNFRVLQSSDDPLAGIQCGNELSAAELVKSANESNVDESSAGVDMPSAEAADGLTQKMEKLAVADQTAQPDKSDHKTQEIEPADIAMDQTTVSEHTPDDGKPKTADEASAAPEFSSNPIGAAVSDAGSETNSIVSEKSGVPQTPPQARSVAGEKPSPFGKRLASSPFLKADRNLGQDHTAISKRVGRIKSPFLENSSANAASIDDNSKAESAAESAGTQSIDKSDKDKLNEKMAELRIENEMQSAKAEDNEDDLVKSALEQAAEVASEDARAESLDGKATPPVAAAGTEDGKTEVKVQDAESKAKTKSTEPETKSQSTESEIKAQGAVPENVPPKAHEQTTPTKATPVSRPVPRSTAGTRTVRKAPVAAPPSTTPTSRRTTLGQVPTASRTAAAQPAPPTPTVTTRAAARAAQATPQTARAAASAKTPTATSATRRTTLGAPRTTPIRTSTRPAVQPATPSATPTRAPIATRARTTASTRPSSTQAAAERTPASGTRARPTPAPVSTPISARRTTLRSSSAASGTSPSTRRVSAMGTANGAQTSPARRPAAPPSSASLVSPRPVTRSMTSNSAASRTRTPTSAGARTSTRAATTTRSVSSRLTAPTAASRARAAAAAAKKGPAANQDESEEA